MAHPVKLKEKAIQMRKEGISIPKIARELGVAKSTSSDWVNSTPLPLNIRKHLKNNSKMGQEKGREVMRVRRMLQNNKDKEDARKIIDLLLGNQDKSFWKILTAILFWCEGGKRQLNTLTFANSDPNLLGTFLHALREGFYINESKFRIALHLHQYHDEQLQKKFWSKVTRIPEKQFSKTYIKPNTQKRQREGYRGCVSLRYYDASLAKKLDAIYHVFGSKIMGAW